MGGGIGSAGEAEGVGEVIIDGLAEFDEPVRLVLRLGFFGYERSVSDSLDLAIPVFSRLTNSMPNKK